MNGNGRKVHISLSAALSEVWIDGPNHTPLAMPLLGAVIPNGFRIINSEFPVLCSSKYLVSGIV